MKRRITCKDCNGKGKVENHGQSGVLYATLRDPNGPLELEELTENGLREALFQCDRLKDEIREQIQRKAGEEEEDQ